MSKRTDTKNAKYQEAIRLKYNGESYPVIAKKLKVSVYTVEGWFAFGGLLKDDYDKFRDEQNEIRKQQAEWILQKNVETAATMLVALMGSADDGVKFRASKEILDRELGSPKETIEHKGLFGSGLNYEQILRKARDKPPDG
jgi:transposase